MADKTAQDSANNGDFLQDLLKSMGEVQSFIKDAASKDIVKKTPDALVNALYAYGYGLWQNRQFAEAHEVLDFVVSFRPDNHRYLEAMARCLYDMERYIEAARFYSMSSLCGGDPAQNLLNITYCQFRQGDLYDARSCLGILIDFGQVEPQEGDAKVSKEIVDKALSLMVLVSNAIAVMEKNGGKMPEVKRINTAKRGENLVSAADMSYAGRQPKKAV